MLGGCGIPWSSARFIINNIEVLEQVEGREWGWVMLDSMVLRGFSNPSGSVIP